MNGFTRVMLRVARGLIVLVVLNYCARHSPPENVTQDPDAVAGQQALEQKEGAKALEAFQRLETKYPQNSLVHYWLGRSHGMLRDNSKAMQSYERAIQINPKNALAWMHLGTTLNAVDPQRSIDAAIKATELAPDSPSAWFLLGVNYLSQEKAPLAVAPLERAVQLDPNFAKAWASLSSAYLLVGDSRSKEARARAEQLDLGRTPSKNSPP
jgi:tetratricopeptide (TPR) repeat protein